jgi:hypothetical protein
MLRCFRNIVLLLAGFLLHGSVVAQGEGDSKVFFLGIGVEKCINGTPGKPNAASDVQLVMARTRKDAQSGDVNFTSNGTSLMVSKAVCYTLLNDQATIRNIDSVIANHIRPLARPQDIFYIYISAQTAGLTGNFTVPGDPQTGTKKGKPAPPQRNILESAHLKELCASVQCQNQILVADAVTWQENHDVLLTELLAPSTDGKTQIVVAPYSESTDSFLVANKYASAFAASIHNAGQPLLRLLVKNSTVTAKVKTSLNNAYNALTANDDPIAEVYESWKIVEGSVGAIAKAAPAPEPQKTIPQPATTATNDRVKRGFEEDAPAPEVTTRVRNYALIIANEHYQNTAAWPTLFNPIADAKALELELKTYYGFEVRLVVDVGLDSMLTEIENLNKLGFNDNSQVIFYYAGHGGVKRNASGSGTGYIVPVDGKSETEDKNLLSYVLYDRIKSTLDGLPAKHVLALVDACFSGSADRNVFAQEMQLNRRDESVQRSSIAVQINEAMKRESRYFIGSGKLTTVPDGVRGKHSPFCAVILHQLETAREKKTIMTISSIEDVMMHELDPQPYGFSFGSKTASCNSFIFCPLSIIPK